MVKRRAQRPAEGDEERDQDPPSFSSGDADDPRRLHGEAESQDQTGQRGRDAKLLRHPVEKVLDRMGDRHKQA